MPMFENPSAFETFSDEPRHWLTIVSGRGDSGTVKMDRALRYIAQKYGPIKEMPFMGSYSMPRAEKNTYIISNGLILGYSFDGGGFTDLMVLEDGPISNLSGSEVKSFIKEVRAAVGIKSPYRDRSPYTWHDSTSGDYFN